MMGVRVYAEERASRPYVWGHAREGRAHDHPTWARCGVLFQRAFLLLGANRPRRGGPFGPFRSRTCTRATRTTQITVFSRPMVS